jgi:peptidoglycan hydrolase-like protein with peptidoglycan-binding domain
MSDGGFGYSSSNKPYSGDPAANSFVQAQRPSSSGSNYSGGGSAVYSGAPAAAVSDGSYSAPSDSGVSSTGYGGHQDQSNASVVTGVGGGDAATGGQSNPLVTANAAFIAGVNVGHAIGSGSAGGTPTGSAASDFHAGMAALPGDIAAVNAMSAIPRETLMSHQDWSGAGGNGYESYLRYMASGGQVDNPAPVRVAAIGAPVVPATSDMPPDLFPGAKSVIVSPSQVTDQMVGGAGVAGDINGTINVNQPGSIGDWASRIAAAPGQAATAFGAGFNNAGDAVNAGLDKVWNAAKGVWEAVTAPSKATLPPAAPADDVLGEPAGLGSSAGWTDINGVFHPPGAYSGEGARVPAGSVIPGPSRSVKTETVTGGPIQEPDVAPATEQSVSIPHAAGPGIQAAADAAGLLPASSSVPPDVTAGSKTREMAAPSPGAIPGGTPTTPYEPYPGAIPATGNTLAGAQKSDVRLTGDIGGGGGGDAEASTGLGVPLPTLRPGMPNLKLGSTGEDVSLIQEQLHRAGYKITVDGKFGPETDKIVRQFEKDQGLKVQEKGKGKGVIGPEVTQALANLLRRQPIAGTALPPARGKQASNALGGAQLANAPERKKSKAT